MVDMDPEGTMSVAKAAQLLGMSLDDAYDLVFRKRLRTVEAPSGRRVVPVSVVEAWLREHPVPA